MIEIKKETLVVRVEYKHSEDFHDYVCYLMANYLKDGYAHVRISSKKDDMVILEVDHIHNMSNGLLSHYSPKVKTEKPIGDTWRRYTHDHKNDHIFDVLDGKEVLSITSSFLSQKH